MKGARLDEAAAFRHSLDRDRMRRETAGNLRRCFSIGTAMRNTFIITLAGAAGLLLSGGAALAGPAANSIPEPATLSLVAGGIGVLAVVRYLRRK